MIPPKLEDMKQVWIMQRFGKKRARQLRFLTAFYYVIYVSVSIDLNIMAYENIKK